MGSLRRRLGLHIEPVSSRRWSLRVAFIFAVLGILVVVSFFIYMSRVRSTPSGGSNYAYGEQTYTQAKTELTAPDNIAVTVDKGATITWDGSDDIRIIGYNVYRFKASEDPGSKVNAAIISDNVYHDDEGTMFNSYAVSTVDTNGREGKISAPVVAVAEPVSLTGLTPTQKPELIQNKTFTDTPQQSLPPTMVGCTADGATYLGVWYLEHYNEVTGKQLMVTPYYGDSFSFTFTGDSVAVISTRHWNYGIMDVYIDGELRQQVDLYSPEVVVNDTVFSTSGLGSGAHTIKLVCTGRKNPDANFTFINVEALQIK
ncbi:MAG: hypothetical protein JW854_14290 [Actinobacteria bacterium]|nr:hypothetical protein [Actinomycetota bacterium]